MTRFLLPLAATLLATALLSCNAQHTQLVYLVRQPTVAVTKPPLLVLLHGLRSNEQDLFALASQLPGKYLVVSVRAPLDMGNGGYAWYQVDFSSGKPVLNPGDEVHSRQLLVDFLAELQKTHPYDPQQVTLCGFSQGAIMSYSVGLTRPDLVQGIGALSGRLLDEVKPAIAPPAQLKYLRVFISHGTSDPMLPIDNAREARAYLEQLGLSPETHEYPAPHTITREMLVDWVKWLE